MGSEKVKVINDAESRQRHLHQVQVDLQALRIMLEDQWFEQGIQRIGAEQELSFADAHWRPASISQGVLARLNAHPFTTEFAQFNLEINLDPIPFTGHCLSTYENTLRTLLGQVEAAAQAEGGRVVLCGILPTVRSSDLSLANLTPLPRYYALVDRLKELRRGPFVFELEGLDHFYTDQGNPLYEGSNTSFQLHLQVDPDEFVALYNWALAICGPVLAAATNSPLLLGKRLWRETRIALFQQSIDTRPAADLSRGRPPRVNFGTDWVRHSVLDLYQSDFLRQPPIMISTQQEDPLSQLAKGVTPHLYGLNVHNGTVYNWNRPCYGISPNGQPHLRIEMRALPAGPSIVDQVANAALWLGLMKALPPAYREIHREMPFAAARENFYTAARQGLSAHFHWPGHHKRLTATELLGELLPLAHEGLQLAGCAPAEAEYYLGIIAERTASGQTGSHWQLYSFNQLLEKEGRSGAAVAVTAAMYAQQQQGDPVHRWPLAPSIAWQPLCLADLMAEDLFTVHPDDTLEYVGQMMEWRNIRHLPVVDSAGQLCGLITARNLLAFLRHPQHAPATAVAAAAIMRTAIISAPPDCTVAEGLRLMQAHGIGCLPILADQELLGLVTETDFLRLAARGQLGGMAD